MDEVEQAVRHAMAAHELDDPGRVTLPVSRPRPSRWRVPVIAACSAAVLIAATVLALRHGQFRPAVLPARPSASATAQLPVPALAACPSGIAQPISGQSPKLPSGSPDSDRLVPSQAPAAALLCGYPAPVRNVPQIALQSGRRLTNLDQLAEQLSWLPPLSPAAVVVCSGVEVLHKPNAYLLELSYPGRLVWVSVPSDPCVNRVTNGRFVTSGSGYVAESAKKAYTTGRWPSATPATDPCENDLGPGRIGQQLTMVPSGAYEISICQQGYIRRTVTAADSVASIVHQLDSLPTKPSTESCAGSGDGGGELLFQYRTGPPVWVRISPACRPSVDNGSLQAMVTPALLNLLGLPSSGN